MVDSGAYSFPQNELEGLLMEATRNPARRDAFRRAVVAARLFVLGTADKQASAERERQARAKVELYGILVEGRRVVPAFTSEARIEEFVKSPQPYLGLAGSDLLDLLEPDVGLALNPSSAYGKEFLPEEVRVLRDLAAALRESKEGREGSRPV